MGKKRRFPSTMKNYLRGAGHRGGDSYLNHMRAFRGGTKVVRAALIFRAVDEARQSVPPNAYADLLRDVKLVFGRDAPNIALAKARKVGDLDGRFAFTPLDLDRELAWAAVVLARHEADLIIFRRLATELEGLFLQGDLVAALARLDDIDAACGYSYWSTELRIALLQEQGGISAQRAYLEQLFETGTSGMPLYVAYMASRRNEDSGSPDQFSKSLESELNQVSRERADYLRFRLGGRSLTEEALPSVLAQEAGASFVDFYETFIDVLGYCSLRNPKGYHEELITPLSAVDDERLFKLRFLVSGDSNALSNVAVRALDANTAFIQGDYTRAAVLAERAYNRNPTDLAALTLQTQSLALADQELDEGSTVAEGLLAHLHTVYTFGDGYLKSLGELHKARLNLSSLPSLRGFLHDALQLAQGLAYGQPPALFLGSCFLEPGQVGALPALLAQDFLTHIESRVSAPLPLEAARVSAKLDTLEGYPLSVEQRLVTGLELEATDRLNFSEIALASTKRPVALRGAILKAHLLVEARDVRAFMAHAAYWCSRNPILAHITPTADAVRGVSLRELDVDFAALSTPIFFHLVLKVYDNADIRDYLRWSADEFLEGHDVTRPSELMDMSTSFDTYQLIYFYRDVCTLDVLEACRGLPSSRAVLEERRNLLSWLIELDSGSADAYKQEITVITTSIAIDEGVQLLDKSRVYVDTVAIERWAKGKLSDTYQRFRVLVSNYESFRLSLQTVISQMLEPNQGASVVVLQDRKASEELLRDMLDALRDQFLNSPEHGLDSFVSMRIRHGTLSGTLRGPLEATQLITVRAESGRYKPHDFWLERLRGVSNDQLEYIETLLSTFARDFDALVEEQIKPVLQIQSEQTPEGMFCLDHDEERFRKFYTELKSDPNRSFDAFLDDAFSYLRQRLRQDLQAARRHLREKVKPDLDHLFHTLRAELLATLEPWQYGGLIDALTEGFTQVQNTFERVLDWLQLHDSADIQDSLSLEQVVNIAITSASQALKGFEPDLTVTADKGVQASTPTLHILADVLYILFDNVYKHSRLGARPQLEVSVSYHAHRGNMDLMVRSQVAPGVRNAGADAKLDRIRNLIQSGSYREHVSSEGGSGLLKLKRISGLRKDAELEFGFDGTNHFFVGVSIPDTLRPLSSEIEEAVAA